MTSASHQGPTIDLILSAASWTGKKNEESEE